MKLIIVESPTKAKTISRYLGAEFEVRASVGHIRDIPKSNKKAIDIPGGFIPHYEIVKGKEKIITELKKIAKKATEVLLTTDPDREGEAIAWHLQEVGQFKNAKRVVFHEITEQAVHDALTHPREIDQNLRKAQEARRVLDRLVGYDLSGLIWKKVRYGLSAGRVQSPALRIIMEREREIRAFIPEKYWMIQAEFTTKNHETLTMVCDKEPQNYEEVEHILACAQKNPWHITTIKRTETKRVPRAPFTTSTLQQTASSRLGMSPSRTMSVAQKLYEQGLITYMRTDSTNLSTIALKEIHSTIEKKFGKEYLTPHTYVTKSKNAQEAHEAIRPTQAHTQYAGQTPEQEKIYTLIWERAISSQMTDAKIMKTKVSANIQSEEKIPDFSINGNHILFPGWLLVDTRARGEEVEIPKLEEGEKLTFKNITPHEKQTEPPGRYSEAGLIKELEKRDIGRPSTYATIISTLLNRGYVEKINKTLIPTDTGDVVSSFLEKNFSNYISDSFTAEMERDLDEIAEGTRDYTKTLKDFYTPFHKDVQGKEKLEKATNLGEADSTHICPVCGGTMVIKLARNGKFLSCAKFPECKGARKIDGTELLPPKETGEDCPRCTKGKLVSREGRFGMFIACSTYPKCKYIKESEEELAKKKTGIQCPECKTGEMVERRGRFGLFYSCSNYPNCKYIIKSKPTGNLCSLCGALMMQGTKTIPDRCSKKTCLNHNPHKVKLEK